VGHGAFPGYGAGSRVFKAVVRRYSVGTVGPPNHPALLMAEGTGVTQTLVDYIEDLRVDPAAANQRSYTVNITARTRKTLAFTGGIRRKSITETVRVRNIP